MRPGLRVLCRAAFRKKPASSLLRSCNQHRHLTTTLQRQKPEPQSFPSPDYESQTLNAPRPKSEQQNQKLHTLSFPGYEEDPLNAPLHAERQHISRPYADPSPEDGITLTDRELTLRRAKKVFGDRTADAEERKRLVESRSQMIAGVLVPPKPEEPDNCCMSGCVNCVWERYREELEEFAAAMKMAKKRQIEMRTQGQATGMMAREAGMPTHAAISMDDDGGGSETLWTAESHPSSAPMPEAGEDADVDPLAGIPIGIREFMKTEKKLKEMHKSRGEHIETALDTELRPMAWAQGT